MHTNGSGAQCWIGLKNNNLDYLFAGKFFVWGKVKKKKEKGFALEGVVNDIENYLRLIDLTRF